MHNKKNPVVIIAIVIGIIIVILIAYFALKPKSNNRDQVSYDYNSQTQTSDTESNTQSEPPTLTTLNPNSGSNLSVITLTGTGFDATSNIVHFGNSATPARVPSTQNGTTITFVPSSALLPPCAWEANPTCPHATSSFPPGIYTVSIETSHGRTNGQQFTIVSLGGENDIRKSDWGVSFEKTSDWSTTSDTNNKITFTQNTGQWKGDIMTVEYMSGTSITDISAKFGAVTYYFDETKKSWMKKTYTDNSLGTVDSIKTAVAVLHTKDNLPVFAGTSSWMTYIIPLSHTTFLKLNITGSGQTEPLKDLEKTIRRI